MHRRTRPTIRTRTELVDGDAAGLGQSGEQIGLCLVELPPGVRNDNLNRFAKPREVSSALPNIRPGLRGRPDSGPLQLLERRIRGVNGVVVMTYRRRSPRINAASLDLGPMTPYE